MTWQDELRRLEDDLVNGRVSAEDYRIRRDQLLTSANASPQQAYQQTSMDNTQIIPPVTDGPPPEATQAISGQQQQAWQQQQQQQQQQPQNQDPERTQAVSPGFHQQGYQQQQNSLFDEPDRTQFVPGPGNPQQQQQDEEPPPWAGNEFPPLMGGANTSEWVKQGPEDSGEKDSKGKIIGVIAGVVVVALLAVGAYFLFIQGGDNTNPSQAGGPGTNQGAGGGNPGQDPSKDLGIVDPPGQKEDHSDVQTLDALKSSNYLNADEQQAYTNAVATRVVFKVGKDSGVTIAMVGAQASTADGAKEAAKALNDAQVKNNMQPMSGNPPKGVYVAELHGKPGSAVEIRAHYAHGTTIVRVHAYGSDYNTVKADFDKALADQLKALPADG